MPCHRTIPARPFTASSCSPRRERRVEAVRAADAGPFHKPLLKLELAAVAPFTVTARVDVQLHHTQLAPGPPPPGRVTPLGPVQRREFLDDGWPDEKARTWFTRWMKSHQLLRGGQADDLLAFRVLKFMREHFRYEIPDNVPAFKTMVARDPVMGDWHYTIDTFSGECMRLSDTYCRVMRMNGIPARLVSGNYFGGDSGHHLRSLIYLPEAGWIPMEVTAAVTSRPRPPLNFFGTWEGTMLIGNGNVDFAAASQGQVEHRHPGQPGLRRRRRKMGVSRRPNQGRRRAAGQVAGLRRPRNTANLFAGLRRPRQGSQPLAGGRRSATAGRGNRDQLHWSNPEGSQRPGASTPGSWGARADAVPG